MDKSDSYAVLEKQQSPKTPGLMEGSDASSNATRQSLQTTVRREKLEGEPTAGCGSDVGHTVNTEFMCEN